MSRLRRIPGWAKATFSALVLVASAGACEEDSKTAPAKCLDLPPPFDIQAGAPTTDNPCVTAPGHSVSQIISGDTGGSPTAGTGGKAGGGAGGTAGKGGNGGAGKGGKGGASTANAGAGGA
jgi:hypothetical protein